MDEYSLESVVLWDKSLVRPVDPEKQLPVYYEPETPEITELPEPGGEWDDESDQELSQSEEESDCDESEAKQESNLGKIQNSTISNIMLFH